MDISDASQDTADPEPVSFTARINELQVQNDYLSQELNFVKFQLEAEIKWRLSLEEKLTISHERQAAIQEDIQKVSKQESYFRNATLKYSQAVARLGPILSELQQDPPVTEDGSF